MDTRKKLQNMEKCYLLPWLHFRKFPVERKRRIIYGEFGDSPPSLQNDSAAWFFSVSLVLQYVCNMNKNEIWDRYKV